MVIAPDTAPTNVGLVACAPYPAVAGRRFGILRDGQVGECPRPRIGTTSQILRGWVLRTNRVRADTTVVPANVCYPTDSGLLAKVVRRISTAGQRIHNAGGAVRPG